MNSEERKIVAEGHTVEMEELFEDLIGMCKEQSYIFAEPSITGSDVDPQFVVEDMDTVSALYKHHSVTGKNTLLNFASYTNPGGGFISGSMAQEESLCHESFLYNVLTYFEKEYYKENRDNKNRGLYSNRGIYSPGILFSKNETYLEADVITCAAPNKTAAMAQGVTGQENTEALDSRIRYVVNIAANFKPDVLILGAYGCGVFGQDPKEVAELFKKHLCGKGDTIKKVVFAIPGGDNLKAFQEVFKEEAE